MHCILVFGALVLASAAAAADTRAVIIAVDATRLAESAGLPRPRTLQHATTGLGYELENGDRLDIAVHTTVALAIQHLKGIRAIVAAPDPDAPPGPPIGDEVLWGVSRPSAGETRVTVILRRNNVIIGLWKRGDPNDVAALVRQIDLLLQTDRQIAPMGTFDPPPRIVETGIPQTLRVCNKRRHEYLTQSGRFSLPRFDFIRFMPRIEGMGPMDRLRVRVELRGTGQDVQKTYGRNQVRPDGKTLPQVYVPISPDRARIRPASPSRDGRFILRVSVPDEPVTCKLTMTVVNDDNVVVTKQETIQVVPQ